MRVSCIDEVEVQGGTKPPGMVVSGGGEGDEQWRGWFGGFGVFDWGQRLVLTKRGGGLGLFFGLRG